jgi:hypothetical protein
MTPAARHVAAEFFSNPPTRGFFVPAGGTSLREVEVAMQYCREGRFDGGIDWSSQ